MKELYEDILGPEAADILVDALQNRAEAMSPDEVEAVQRLQAGAELTNMDKISLNGLVMALADDFGTRRRAQELHRILHQPPPPSQEEEEDWIPDDLEEEGGEGPDGEIGPSMGDFLDSLGEKDEISEDDEVEDL